MKTVNILLSEKRLHRKILYLDFREQTIPLLKLGEVVSKKKTGKSDFPFELNKKI